MGIHQHKEFVTEGGEVGKNWQQYKKKHSWTLKNHNFTQNQMNMLRYSSALWCTVQPPCRVSRAGPSPKCATIFHLQGLQTLSRPCSPSSGSEGLHEIRAFGMYPSLWSPFSNEIPEESLFAVSRELDPCITHSSSWVYASSGSVRPSSESHEALC